MSDIEIPDFAALFSERDQFTESIRQLMARQAEEMYLAGFEAALMAVGGVLRSQQAHTIERIVVDEIGIPILHRLHTTIEERRQRG